MTDHSVRYHGNGFRVAVMDGAMVLTCPASNCTWTALLCSAVSIGLLLNIARDHLDEPIQEEDP